MNNVSSVHRALDRIQADFAGLIKIDDLTRAIYSTDASVYQQTPVAVTFPRNENDVQLLIRLAGDEGVGLIPRTAGTSLAGQVVGPGIVVDVSRHFTEILEINRTQKWVRVQPGVIRDELNMALAEHGLFFGPETSTANRAMLGGMLGNNSCGANSIVYGTTRDQTLELRGYLSDGSHVSFGPMNRDEIEAAKHSQDDSFQATIVRQMLELISDQENRRQIQQEFPRPQVTRRNTGYALDCLIEADSLNLCQLIAGSEGTLFFATEIKLRCQALPAGEAGLYCPHFETVEQALRATQIIMRHAVFSCELVDQLVLRGAARNIEQKQHLQYVIGDPGAILMVEVRRENRQQIEDWIDSIQRELKNANLGYAYPVFYDAAARSIWSLRKAGLGMAASMVGDEKPVAVIEDAAVAVEDLPDYVRDVGKLLKTTINASCVHYGHAGAGELHLRPILNLKTTKGVQAFRQIAEEVAKIVKRYRGSLSGEHGDGRLRGEFLKFMLGEKNFELLRTVKQIWDPQHIFNPGKIVDVPAMDSHLRYQRDQTSLLPTTVFDFRKTNGLLGAAEMCSGSGDCRKTHLSGGTMCPSYMATRNEQDTTRARANVLRQVLTGNSNTNPLNSQQLKQVMDLCLSCKGCKSECPSNVDVAKMKAEFLQAYYDANGVSRRARIIAAFDRINKIASLAPWLYNLIATNWVTSSLIKSFCGFHASRSLPKLHRQTMRQWFNKHVPHAKAGRIGQVWLYCDEFTNYQDVPIGIATVELLERLGYVVNLVNQATQSGRAAISAGLLRQASSIAAKNVALLSGLLSPERPLIGIEPSALLTLRDEYPDLLQGKMRDSAIAIAENSFLVDEFLSNQMYQGNISSASFTKRFQTVRLHGHCHQRALASLKATIRALQLPSNYRVKLIPSGCCGMAGSFGYEREHYETSMEIGRLVLFPAIEQEPVETIIAAPGTSCRQQILDGTGRQACHPVEILRDALTEQ